MKRGMRVEREEARAGGARASFTLRGYLHPVQDAQQSAEGQHAGLAAFAAPVMPSATTANSRIALMVFITFSFFG